MTTVSLVVDRDYILNGERVFYRGMEDAQHRFLVPGGSISLRDKEVVHMLEEGALREARATDR